MIASAKAKTKIICVGNRFVVTDDIGPRVFDYLTQQRLPDNVEVIDGGLQGLNLLGLIEGAEKVIFVDSIKGYGNVGDVVVLDGLREAENIPTGYGHSGGLTYLLKVLPDVCEGNLPAVFVVGMEGPTEIAMISKIAEVCIDLIHSRA